MFEIECRRQPTGVVSTYPFPCAKLPKISETWDCKERITDRVAFGGKRTHRVVSEDATPKCDTLGQATNLQRKGINIHKLHANVSQYSIHWRRSFAGFDEASQLVVCIIFRF